MSRSWLVAYQLTSCVYGRGFAEGREESGICDSGRGALTHGGCGRKVNSLHKQLNYSFIINTNVHTNTLHILFICSLYLWVLGGAAWLERPEHLPAAQMSPLHHQLLSIYCEGKRTETAMIKQSWQAGKWFAADLWQTHMVTFRGDWEVVLQHIFSEMVLLGVKGDASAWPFPLIHSLHPFTYFSWQMLPSS